LEIRKYGASYCELGTISKLPGQGRLLTSQKKAQVPSARKTGNIPTYAPNQTLYINNIPSAKIQKPDLRIALYALFSTYGPVLDVVALRTMKMRGQAHIVFRDIQAATQAMRALQGFDFFGKEMVRPPGAFIIGW
jgi:U2 small nuclear ribonucleoprotein B''